LQPPGICCCWDLLKHPGLLLNPHIPMMRACCLADRMLHS
jgi:hypothetical protein